MVFLESTASAWLLVHAVIGGATVAAATHLVVWMRGYLRGDFRRHAAVRRFTSLTLGLYATTFLLGNLLYPTYKVRVRPELGGAARLFDVKEHWVALGLALAMAAVLLAWTWEPKRDGARPASFLFALGAGTAACAWLALLVGLRVTAIRAVGAP